MSVTTENTGPYTSPKVVIDLIERHRERGLPQPVDAATLARAGVSESLIPRTLQSLVALDLIEDNGQISEALEAMRLAPQGEFKQRVKEWLDAAYADVLQFTDPASDDETKVRDAFRNYKPVGQQGRMVTLFLRLYEYAGVELPQAAKPVARPRPAVVRDRVRVREVAKAPRETLAQPTRKATTGLPPAIAGLLESLPQDGQGWTETRRDGFLTAFTAVLGFCFPITTEATSSADADEE